MSMLADLLHRLTHPKPKPLPELDARLALAALLVRVAKTDGTYVVQEISRIDRILAKTFALNVVEAAKLRADAERLEHDAPDVEDFAAAIRQTVDVETREDVMAALWQVALADGVRKPEEDSFLASMATRLEVDAEHMARAQAVGSEDKTVVPWITTPKS